MLQKKTSEQLNAMSDSAIKTYRVKVKSEIDRLQEMKKANPESFTPEMQAKLDDLVKYSEGVLNGKQDEVAKYVPAKGTEDLVHLRIVKGHRFSPTTGKEVSEPFVQLYSRSEWRLFKEHHKSLGYTIVEVLHDPTGEAVADTITDKSE